MTHAGLSGTTAIVTGASRGFGLAIAEALVEAGAWRSFLVNPETLLRFSSELHG